MKKNPRSARTRKAIRKSHANTLGDSVQSTRRRRRRSSAQESSPPAERAIQARGEDETPTTSNSEQYCEAHGKIASAAMLPSGPAALRLEWWEADRLAPHPQNWRRHPDRQKQALQQLLREVGWAGALLYNERTGRLLDGHLRKELCHGERVPVLVGSWSEEQERKILALLDPLAALAEPDEQRWHDLLRELGEMDGQLAQALDRFAQRQELPVPSETLQSADLARAEASLPEARFEVIVSCDDEASQQQLYQRLTAEGYRCRVLTF